MSKPVLLRNRMSASVGVDLAAWLMVALTARLILAAQDISSIDRLFLPDDTYYSLAIARNIARHLGPSADGVVLTNGFQALITFFQVPLFWAGLSTDGAIRGAVLETCVFGACAAAAAGSLLAQLGMRKAAWAAALVMALHPAIVSNDLNGLEASLSVLLSLISLHALTVSEDTVTRGRAIFFGLTMSATVMARVDTCFLIACVFCVALCRWPFRRTALMGASAALGVAPWWLYQLCVFGSIIPESGPAVHQWAGLHLGLAISTAALIVAALCAIGQLLSDGTVFSSKNLICGVFVLIAVAASLLGIGTLRSRKARVLIVIGVVSLTQILFYIFYVKAFWFFPRYLAFVYVATIIILADAACSILRVSWRLSAGQYAAFLCAAIAFVFVAPGIINRWQYFLSRPSSGADGAYIGPNGYRDQALAILPHVPGGSAIGAFQSGALSYYADRNIRVVNLDGVVNHDARTAIANGALRAYIAKSGLRYIADWDLNLRLIRRNFGDSSLPNMTLLYTAPPQGSFLFKLYRLEAIPSGT